MPLDLGNIPGSANRFEHVHDTSLRAMQRRVAQAAAEERRTHGYRNRTGNLQASTQASPLMEVGDTAAVTLAADAPYASYVNDRGLMRIDEVAASAAEEIDFLFDGVAATARVL